eukprot:m.488072 g.488072  ORF g.488072 m.488072 type:complete len:431 (+) comp25521_c0_seq1:92-1384(+)
MTEAAFGDDVPPPYFSYIFYFCLLLLGGVTYLSRDTSKGASATSADFKNFQFRYLVVYLVMMAADWMQGPYVYALYSFYGFTMEQNGQLFIVGFGTSMIFGIVAGSLVDKYGRKLGCVMYGIVYMASCVTKHHNSFHTLMLGRVLGGIATSILFSAFESWMISQHNKEGFEPDLMSGTFSYMFMGNGLVAIGAGWLAQQAVDYVGHPVAPFDLSFVFLGIGTVLIFYLWTENYGDRKSDISSSVSAAWKAIREDRKVMLLGVIQSLFEGAMYTFVFMWTPTLEAEGLAIPHGLVFASFMVCSSIGGAVFKLLVKTQEVRHFMHHVFAAAALSLLVPVLVTSTFYRFVAFLVFEVSVGIFWPGMGTLRSKHVAEETRATVMNFFRIPLNLMVCLILLYVSKMAITTVFTLCFLFLAACYVAQLALRSAIGA